MTNETSVPVNYHIEQYALKSIPALGWNKIILALWSAKITKYTGMCLMPLKRCIIIHQHSFATRLGQWFFQLPDKSCCIYPSSSCSMTCQAMKNQTTFWLSISVLEWKSFMKKKKSPARIQYFPKSTCNPHYLICISKIVHLLEAEIKLVLFLYTCFQVPFSPYLAPCMQRKFSYYDTTV